MSVAHDYVQIASCDTDDLPNWVAIGDGALSNNTTIYREGDAGINIYKPNTTQTLFGAYKDIPTVNMKNKALALFLWIKSVEVLEKIASCKLRVYDVNGNWGEYDVTHLLRAGWHIIGMPVDTYAFDNQSATAPDLTQVSRIEIRFETTDPSITIDEGDIVMDNWVYGQYFRVIYGTESEPWTFDKVYREVHRLKLPIMEKIGNNCYVLIGRLYIGDNYHETWFIDKNFVLISIVNSNSWGAFFTNYNYAKLRLGEIIEEATKRTAYGGVIVNASKNCYASVFGGAGTESRIECYGTVFKSYYARGLWINDAVAKPETPNRFWNISAMFRVQNIFMYHTEIYNWIATEPEYGLQIKSTTPRILSAIVKGGYEGIRLGSWNYSARVENIIIQDTGRMIYCWGASGNPSAELVNIETTTWKTYIAGTEGTPFKILIKYRVKFRVKDKDGNPLSGRLLKIYDRNGNYITELSTDVNGETDYFELPYAKLEDTLPASSHLYDYDDYYKFFPYTIEVWYGAELEAKFIGVNIQMLAKDQVIELFVKPSRKTLDDIITEIQKHHRKIQNLILALHR